MKSNRCLIVFILLFLFSCANSPSEKENKLVIFHAGSLSVPFKKIIEGFKKENPGVDVFAESSGSLDAARKVTDLKKNCDLLAVSDYLVIDKLMIPEHADKNEWFATNRMVIAYRPESKYADSISNDNWHEIFQRSDVTIGRSDPNADPCGYRSIFVFELAERHYGISRLANTLTGKKETVIRPKEVDLLALLETLHVDYILIYQSVAMQHHLKYMILPDAVNLSNPAFEKTYNGVSAVVNGSVPGEKTSIKGSSIVYSYCFPKNSGNPSLAKRFADYLKDPLKGGKVLEECGMTPYTGN